VVIDHGLVLTIGYLITEAEAVWLHRGDGSVVEGHALGFDFESGFGLVQALGDLDLEPLPLGSSAPRKSATAWWSAAPAGRTRSVASQIAPSRNSPAIGNICWMKRSSPIPRTRTGAAPG
jgi:S1-C subfamily serine protease